MRGFENISYVYFVGIGGIGMSALARLFHHHGLQVAGYDRTPTALTNQLLEEGIRVHFEDLGKDAGQLAGTPENTLVVVTPAVPLSHKELQWFSKNRYSIWKRSRLLGHICKQYSCLAVAGTHGKTTVSTMIATILNHTPEGCGAILGGISKNFDTNLLIPDSDNQWMVTEADEYDRSFLQLSPDVAVVTSVDADHLDVYGHHHQVISSFLDFAGNIRPGGTILVKKPIEDYFTNCKKKLFTYALMGDADFTTQDLHLDQESHCYVFRLSTPGGNSGEIHMNYPGLLNVENAVAAGAASYLAGASLDDILTGLEDYSGVRRRFDVLFKKMGIVYIDDYAHHPEELRAFILSVRALYPDKHITGIFQPHLYTRTRDFADGFAKSLDLLDTALLIPVYPARELPIPGVSSEMLLYKMTIQDKYLIGMDEVVNYIRHNRPEILLTMGAGDIELIADEIIKTLGNETED